MQKDFKKETGKPGGASYDVFVPITSLIIYGDHGADEILEPAKTREKYSVGDSEVEFHVLTKRTSLKEDISFSFEDNLKFGTSEFSLRKMMSRGENHFFNSGFLFKYHQKDSNSFMVFPHQFENAVRNLITFLRLYTPGDLYAPYALIDNKDIVEMHDFSSTGHSNSYSSIYYRNISKFLAFYEKYQKLAVEIKLESEKDNTDKLIKNWFKRINNAIYFYNRIYFAESKNQYNPDARAGNNLRLIYLTTALDALLGDGNANGKLLAKKAHSVLGKINPKVKDDIEAFYADRSNYIHANPELLKSNFSDKAIKQFSIYIQKLLLVSLELSQDKDYLNILKTKNAKHWFKGLADSESEPLIRNALKSLFSYDDGYELMNEQLREARMHHWESGLI